MDTRALTLQQIVGRLSALGARKEELARFERRLAEHLAADANIAIRGNRLAHELDEVSPREPDLQGDLFARPTPSTGAGSPTVFRRETPFRSNLLGNSVPAWAIGAAPAESFGPFTDEHGLPVWFDIFLSAPLVSFTFSGATTPALRARVRRTLTNAESYRLEPGSIWIASFLIARTPELQGFYTGLRITGGTIDLSQAATVSGDTLILAPTTTVTVHLDLDQRAAPTERPIAGVDAFDATVQLPKTLDLTFALLSSTLRADAASCTVFGCDVNFEQSGAPPVWIPLIGQILVPFSATTRTNTPDHFEVFSSQSASCTVAGRAPIDPPGNGWVLPAMKADPMTLGDAAGTGALGIAMSKGLTARWKNLQGSHTLLLNPEIIVEPGLVTVLDFVASNAEGRQRWTLWRNAANRHRSQIVLGFGPRFPFMFTTSAADGEGVFFVCRHKADLDRPVDANGTPFVIQSSVAFAALLQSGATFRVLLFDNDLLEDETASQILPSVYSVALRNAVFGVSGARSLSLLGELEDGHITKGTLTLTHDIGQYLPTLPDPYVASYTAYLRDAAAHGSDGLQQSLTAFVKWPDLSPAAHDAPPDAHERAFVITG